MQRRVLVTSLEFVQPLFSGNGIMTQSVVRGLLHLNYHVTVLCARPSNDDPNAASNEIIIDSKDTADEERMDNHPNLTVLVVDVPPSTWKKLDRYSCYEHLAKGAVKAFRGDGNIDHDDEDAKPSPFDYVFGIDWSSIPTIETLKEHKVLSPNTIFVFLVFRVFSSSKELCSSRDDYNFYVTREIGAIQKADITFVLSHVDQASLTRIQKEQNDKTSTTSTTPVLMKELHVHVPPLRNDFYLKCQKLHTPISNAQVQQGEQYVMCNVRLSPEKNALLFAKMMKGLSEQNVLQSLNLVPIMIGAVCDEKYAKEVYDTLPSNTVIVNKFLNSAELISILSQTILMIHPPLYDAFGMTIAEGAAIGVPSLIHCENIGASSLFQASKDEIIEEDLTSPHLFNQLQLHLESKDRLMKISQNAKRRAMSWSVKEYAEGLSTLLDSLQ